MNLLLALRTLRYLRWEQLLYRPWRLAQFRLYRAWPSLTARWIAADDNAPPASPQTLAALRTLFENSFPHLTPPLSQLSERITDLQTNRFTFLSRTLTLAPLDWNQRYESHLWNYQLHYFPYALWCARAFDEGGDHSAMRQCQRLIESWLAQARIGHSDGWDAYPISLRTVNWMYAYALVVERYDDTQFLKRWRGALFRQLDFLRHHLELHLLANHLFKNIKALIIGGLFFQHEEWLTTGLRLFQRELAEQVLPDGGHYERAPMYHAQTLADALECYALLRACGRTLPQESQLVAQLQAMTGFLAGLSYADGSLALFNDSANTEEARPQPILAAAEQILRAPLPTYPTSFPQTGYFLWRSPDEQEKIIVDAGPPAVGYNTAHAHCDLLSYELRLNGQPFIVDSGVHGYGGDRFRPYCRSTRAHNTVMFGGREQSEIWSTFRLARRATVLHAEAQTETQGWQFCGAYQPFYDRRLVHERRITRTTNGEWLFADSVRDGMIGDITSFIHLHPDVKFTLTEDSLAVRCTVGDSVVWIEPTANAASRLIVEGGETPVQGWYFSDFGNARPSATICFTYVAAEGDAFGYRIKRS